MTLANGELRFGVELEFLVRVPHDIDFNGCNYEHRSSGLPLRRRITQTLDEVTSLTFKCQCEHPDSLEHCQTCEGVPPARPTPKSPHHIQNCPLEYRKFMVKYEHIQTDEDRTCGVEISSPILSNAELAAGMPMLDQVNTALIDMDLELSVNSDCGLHVHVGSPGGINLLIAQRAVTLTLLIEKALIIPLCTTKERRDQIWGQPVGETSFIKTAAEDSGIMAAALAEGASALRANFPIPEENVRPEDWNANNPQRFYNMLLLLWQCESPKELSDYLKVDEDQRGSVALVLRERPGTSSTLEFRYSAMTFNMQIIKNYTRLCARIVELAKLDVTSFGAKMIEVVKVLRASSRNHRPVDEPLWRLLVVLGLQRQAPTWYEHVQQLNRGTQLHLDKDGNVQRKGSK
ncbi:hypothetical protein S40293_07481 [Stachybotrys chartarum IBT 40293]|nr:hypothetical protein S40293_07481 [Stachybotrys chartarum IBT 40293]